MKYLLVVFSLFVVTVPCSTQELQWYGFGGFAMFDEDIEAGVGDGAGFRAGLGLQFNERFGVEAFMDRAPELSPDTLLSDLGRSIISYDISTVGNTYISIGGTLTYPFSDKFSGIVKSGVSNYSVEIERFVVDEIDLCDLAGCDDSGTEVFFSGGLIVQMNEASSMEFSFTQFTGDAEALTLNAIFRYQF